MPLAQAIQFKTMAASAVAAVEFEGAPVAMAVTPTQHTVSFLPGTMGLEFEPSEVDEDGVEFGCTEVRIHALPAQAAAQGEARERVTVGDTIAAVDGDAALARARFADIVDVPARARRPRGRSSSTAAPTASRRTAAPATLPRRTRARSLGRADAADAAPTPAAAAPTPAARAAPTPTRATAEGGARALGWRARSPRAR